MMLIDLEIESLFLVKVYTYHVRFRVMDKKTTNFR